MRIQKRTLAIYIFLNCITLGIYGFVVGKQMGDEINVICKGDKESPRFSYVATVFLGLIPIFGPIYYRYWWYQQANRLKMNANRYGIEVKESGTEIFLMRTVLELPFFFVTYIEMFAALLLPLLVVVLFSYLAPVVGGIFAIVFGLVLLLFINELTFGANLSMFYMMKNLNRFADVYRNGGEAFDPMAYEYYPCVSNKYVKFVPGVMDQVKAAVPVTPVVEDLKGLLVGMKGSCAGYEFDLLAGEEIIIGKDAKMSSVVIDPAYKEVSRKHVSVCYDKIRDQYRVVDFSSNGTWANEEKLVTGQPTYLYRGSTLKLANDKNIFRLG